MPCCHHGGRKSNSEVSVRDIWKVVWLSATASVSHHSLSSPASLPFPAASVPSSPQSHKSLFLHKWSSTKTKPPNCPRWMLPRLRTLQPPRNGCGQIPPPPGTPHLFGSRIETAQLCSSQALGCVCGCATPPPNITVLTAQWEHSKSDGKAAEKTKLNERKK